jgi:hypothetical protein
MISSFQILFIFLWWYNHFFQFPKPKIFISNFKNDFFISFFSWWYKRNILIFLISLWWVILKNKKIHFKFQGQFFDFKRHKEKNSHPKVVKFIKTFAKSIYSLRFDKISRLWQRHSLQNTTLTSLFYKNIYWKVIYVYFYENDFQNKYIDMIFHISKLNNLKVIHHLYF